MFPGKREAQERAEAVIRRRSQASALTTDLDEELADVRVTLELDKPGYNASDFESVAKPLARAQQLMDEIYKDVNFLMNQVVPDKINSDYEAQQYLDPAFRIEAKAAELRDWLKRANAAKSKLDVPRQDIDRVMQNAERTRLMVETALSQARQIVASMKDEHADGYREASAGLLTAEREAAAANQLFSGAQAAVGRYAYREGLDLLQRAQSMLDSSSMKLDRIKRAGQDFQKAANDAEATLNKALARLQEAKTELANRAAILSPNPNLYFQGAVQRLGEARRAMHTTPPQAVTCYRLATEALTLIEDALQRARDEVKRLRDGRINARSLFQKLQDIVTETRLTINQKDAVPVKAKDMYTSARDARDSLTGVNIDTLSPQELDAFATTASNAIKLAETALGILRK